MTRPCAWCGQRHDWFAMPLIDSGHDPNIATFGFEMRNNPHGGSICERAGVAWAARTVQIPTDVTITMRPDYALGLWAVQEGV